VKFLPLVVKTEDKVMIGPNVTIATANHPIDPELRARGLSYENISGRSLKNLPFD